VSFWTERKTNSVGNTSAIKQIRNITKEEAEEILAAFCSGYPDLTNYNETMQRLRERDPFANFPRSTVLHVPPGTP
jgi:hypothetical protein